MKRKEKRRKKIFIVLFFVKRESYVKAEMPIWKPQTFYNPGKSRRAAFPSTCRKNNVKGPRKSLNQVLQKMQKNLQFHRLTKTIKLLKEKNQPPENVNKKRSNLAHPGRSGSITDPILFCSCRRLFPTSDR